MGCGVPVDETLVYFTILLSSILSFISSLLLILMYLLVKSVRAYSFRLIFYIAISDLVRSAACMVPCNQLSNRHLITLISYLIHTTVIITCIWTLSITSTLYQIIVKCKQNFEKDHMFWVALTVVALSLNIIPCFFDIFASVDTLCTYDSTIIGWYLRIFGVFVPMWSFIIISIWTYWKIYRISVIISIEPPQRLIIKKIVVFPVLTCIIYLPFSIFRLVEFFIGGCESSLFYLLSINLFMLHGLFMGLAYFWSFNLKKDLLEFYYESKAKFKVNSESYGSINLLYSSFAGNIDELDDT